jgi:hypothetical protein
MQDNFFVVKLRPSNPCETKQINLEEAKAAFNQAQAVEEQFRHDFNGVDFTVR